MQRITLSANTKPELFVKDMNKNLEDISKNGYFVIDIKHSAVLVNNEVLHSAIIVYSNKEDLK